MKPPRTPRRLLVCAGCITPADLRLGRWTTGRVIVGEYDAAHQRRQAKRNFDEAYEIGRTAGHPRGDQGGGDAAVLPLWFNPATGRLQAGRP